MAQNSTVVKAELQVSDMDRHYYATHNLTLAQHPSETDERLMVRLIAFALYADDRLEFGRGLSDEDEPSLWRRDYTDEIELWIDLGQPDDARIRRACSRADQVVVLCYSSSCDVWWKQIAGKLTRFANLTVWQLPAETSQALAALAERSMRLQCMVQDGEIWINTDTASVPVKLATLQAAA